MAEGQQNPQSKSRPKIKSSFGAAIVKTQQEAEKHTKDTSRPVSQSRSIPSYQDTRVLTSPMKDKIREKRTKKGVYLAPDIAKWLDIQAATEGREISELTEEALMLLRRIRTERAKVVPIT